MMKYLPYYYALEQLTTEMVQAVKRTLNDHDFADFTFEKPIRLYDRLDAPAIESISVEEGNVVAMVVTDDMVNDTRHEFRTKLESLPADTVFTVLRTLVLYTEVGVFERPAEIFL